MTSQDVVPRYLAELVGREPVTVDLERVARRVATAGVTELALDDPERPTKVIAKGPGLHIWVDVTRAGGDVDVGVALEELVDYLTRYALLRRLHIANTDMELAAAAARELAPYRHKIGGPEPPAQGQLAIIGEVLEAGIVIVYARNFTGRAALGNRWRPSDPADREVHGHLMQLRHEIPRTRTGRPTER